MSNAQRRGIPVFPISTVLVILLCGECSLERREPTASVGTLTVLLPATPGRRNLTNSGIADVAWSSDGLYLAAVSQSGKLYVWDNRSGTARLTSPQLDDGADGHHFANVAWSPRGHRLAVASGKGGTIIDASDPRSRRHFAHQTFVGDLTWSPDGSSVAAVTTDCVLQVWGTRSWHSIPSNLPAPHAIRIAGWSTDSQLLFIVTPKFEIAALRPLTQQVDFIIPLAPLVGDFAGDFQLEYNQCAADSVSWNAAFAVSPDRSLLAVGVNEVLCIVDMQQRRRLRRMTGDGNISDVSWDHEGNKLAIARNKTVAAIIDPWSGRTMATASDVATYFITAIDWQPRQPTIAIAGYGDEVVLWRLGAGPGRSSRLP